MPILCLTEKRENEIEEKNFQESWKRLGGLGFKESAMGDLLSTLSTNPSDTTSRQTTMSSIEASQISETNQTEKLTSESKTMHQTPELLQFSDPQMDGPKAVEGQEPINSEEADQEGEGEGEGEDEEEEEGECGFCLFMKGGGCKDSFIAWENCIEEAEKNKEDIVEKCFEVTGALKKCMEAHSDYYAPILQAEKAAEEEAVRELEREKAKESSSSGSEEQTNTEGSEQDRPVGSKKSEGS